MFLEKLQNIILNEKTSKYCISLFILIIGFKVYQNIWNELPGAWSIGELLINYEGGFVRRGLLGQLFYFTGYPAFYATLFLKIIILFFFICFISFIVMTGSKRDAWAIFFAVAFSAWGAS